MRRRAVVAGLLIAASPACRKPPAPRADCLRLEAPAAPVGFDTQFTVRASLACADVGDGRVAWRQLSGPALRANPMSADGMAFTARMPSLADAVGAPLPWGIVPLSPRTRGEVVLEATWTGSAGRELSAQAHVAAAARARGVPNTPVGTRVYLGGGGWQVTARPAGSTAAIDAAAGAASLLPDVAGDWRLADGGGRTLALRTARYDETPLDCGRAGCHADIAAHAARSPMTTVMSRGLAAAPDGGRAFGAGYPGCAIACHATGEPGTGDGGFAHVAAELGAAGDANRSWYELPRALRRLGGVGCLACHGPAAIPEASARWSVLRADVCAVCHDVPPRYGHVAAWQGTRMAHADRDPRARSELACARCHTTWGFLSSLSKGDGHVDRRPPAQAGEVGITCAACHAVHDRDTGGPAGHLLRVPPAPALLADVTRGSVCLPCHTPDAAAATPSASAAALAFGRGGLDPATGGPLTGKTAHVTIPGGCVGCHQGGPASIERGGRHAFAVPRAACTRCHGDGPTASDLPQQARRLWDLWRAGAATALPPHAAGAAPDRTTPVGRALWNVLLVLEDPAAATHNAGYARALLAAAEPVLSAAAERRPAKGRR